MGIQQTIWNAHIYSIIKHQCSPIAYLFLIKDHFQRFSGGKPLNYEFPNVFCSGGRLTYNVNSTESPKQVFLISSSNSKWTQQGVTLTSPYLKDGVLFFMLGGVAGGMFPWNLKASYLTVHPYQTRVIATVDLSHKPGLQPHAPWLTGHILLHSIKPQKTFGTGISHWP